MGCVQACLLDLAGGSPARRPAPRARRTLLEDTFRFIDTDSSGFIDMDELVSFGAFTGRNWTPEYVRVLLKSIDTDGDGQVSPDEFLAFCDKELRNLESEGQFRRVVLGFMEVAQLDEERATAIKEVFALIDLEGHGSVNRHALLRYGRALNPNFGDRAVDKLMKQLDLNQDGVVTEAEFTAYMARQSKDLDTKTFFRGIAKYKEAISSAADASDTGAADPTAGLLRGAAATSPSSAGAGEP